MYTHGCASVSVWAPPPPTHPPRAHMCVCVFFFRHILPFRCTPNGHENLCSTVHVQMCARAHIQSIRKKGLSILFLLQFSVFFLCIFNGEIRLSFECHMNKLGQCERVPVSEAFETRKIGLRSKIHLPFVNVAYGLNWKTICFCVCVCVSYMPWHSQRVASMDLHVICFSLLQIIVFSFSFTSVYIAGL